MSNFLTLVTASRDSVRIELVRPDSETSTTVLGVWTFQRLTADIALLWTVDGRNVLTISQRLMFAFRALRMTKKIVG